MKLSLAWIFDHLKASVRDYESADIVARLNKATAEVEHYYAITTDLSLFSLARCIEVKNHMAQVYSAEWDKNFSFHMRDDVQPGSVYMVTKQGWASLAHFNSFKEGLLPALSVVEQALDGSWKEKFETEDVILEVDNKSITHRPDLWSHRGFARELSALLDIALRPLHELIEEHPFERHETLSSATDRCPFTLEVKNHEAIKQFAGLYVEHLPTDNSSLSIAHRLLKVDQRPLNMTVDVTNYVMLDMGQPLHAFDAYTIPSKKIVPRLAHDHETVLLLDAQVMPLTIQDIVIADERQPLALAGIMGAQSTAITHDTQTVFFEAACFDAALIRKTSARIKKRTEASARFEKGVDPALGILALQRLIKLMREAGVPMTLKAPMIVIGKHVHAQQLTVRHTFLEQRLGRSLDPHIIKRLLSLIEFAVTQTVVDDVSVYTVTIPTFRTTKEPLIPEDIVEEIGRLIGYDMIDPITPALALQPFTITGQLRVRTLKHYLAYAAGMRELYTYALYDEEFLYHMQWQPTNAVVLRNPISEQSKRLVTSLVPHLFRALCQHEAQEEQLKFFEWARVWLRITESTVSVVEKKSLGGIVFSRKQAVDFYEQKTMLNMLAAALAIDLAWVKPEQPLAEWYNPYQAAVLIHDGFVIGTAGMADRVWMNRFLEGHAFIFELDGDFLASYKAERPQFKPLAKYPVVWLDVSLLVPVACTVEQVTDLIKNVDGRIRQVTLIDFFERPEWTDQRSLTFRYYVYDDEKTMEKNEIDDVMQAVQGAVLALGATIR
jgi:phenylalanyl-tRNA synthetase beta chain